MPSPIGTRDPRVRRKQADRTGRQGGDGERDQKESSGHRHASPSAEDVGQTNTTPNAHAGMPKKNGRFGILGDEHEQHPIWTGRPARLREIENGADDAGQDDDGSRRSRTAYGRLAPPARPPKYQRWRSRRRPRAPMSTGARWRAAMSRCATPRHRGPAGISASLVRNGFSTGSIAKISNDDGAQDGEHGRRGEVELADAEPGIVRAWSGSGDLRTRSGRPRPPRYPAAACRNV